VASHLRVIIALLGELWLEKQYTQAWRRKDANRYVDN